MKLLRGQPLLVHLFLLCLSGGALLGVISGALAILRHDYITTGMWVNAAILMRDHTLLATWLGCVTGGIACVLWWFATDAARHPRLMSWLGLPAESATTTTSSSALGPCITCAAGCAAMLLIRSIVIGHVANPIMWFTVVGAATWCGLFHWARRGRTQSRVPLLLYAGLLFCVVFGTFVQTHQEREVPLALCACTVILLATAFSPAFRDRSGLGSAPRWSTVGLGVLGAGLPLSACLAATLVRPPLPGSTPPRNIILIGIDTLRLDRTNLRDDTTAKRSYTPRLNELAHRGTVFENAISQAPWTLPAFSSIMTGLYPHDHGAVSLFGELRDSEVTVAEVLREHGYATAAVVSHVYVDAARGFAQGFDEFDESCALGHEAITAADVTDRAIETLDDRGDRPLFMFVHYFDPHSEFNDHADWGFADHYHGWLNGPQNDLRNLRNKRHLLDDEDIAYLSDLYDEEVAYTDREIGRLLDHLEYAGLDDNTIIVVTADHGEELMDRGWIGHTISLFDELIRVPLLVVVPGAPPARTTVAATVETRALFPTILEWAELKSATPADVGPSLIPRLAAASATPDPHAHMDALQLNRAFSSVWLPDAELKTGKRVQLLSLRTDTWKLVQDHTKDQTFLFDLVNDPAERTNVAPAHPDKVAALRAQLTTWWGGEADREVIAPTSQPTGADMAKLRALGYVE